MRSPSRVRRVLLRAAIFLGVVAIGLELGSRALLRFRGKSWDPAAARSQVAEACRFLSRRVEIKGGHRDEGGARESPGSPILHPYLAWALLATQEQIADDLEQAKQPRPPGVYDVYIFGGSVAHGFAELGAAPLVEAIKRDPRFAGHDVRVHNYSVWGYKQLQQLTLLAYILDLGQKPDAIIELDGLNEAAQGWINARAGTHPLYPSIAYWANATYGLRPDEGLVEALHDLRVAQDRAAEFGESLLASPFWRGSFLGQVGLSRFEALRGKYAAANKAYLRTVGKRPRDNGIRGPRFPDDDPGLVRTILTGWEQSAISMHALCAEHGITYLHVLQPTLHDKGSKVLTAKEVETGTADPNWVEGCAELYGPMREGGKRLSERGVAFCDASMVFSDHAEDIYYDVCHFKEHGNAILAAAVAKAFLEVAKP
jgi:hypothetical protein